MAMSYVLSIPMPRSPEDRVLSCTFTLVQPVSCRTVYWKIKGRLHLDQGKKLVWGVLGFRYPSFETAFAALSEFGTVKLEPER